MVEYKKAVAVRYNNVKELYEYRPPRGIDLHCFELDDYSKRAMVQLICNSEAPDIRDRRYKEDLESEISNLQVAIDNVTNNKNCPKGQQVTHETRLDMISNDMDYLRSRVKPKKTTVNYDGNFAELDIA